MSSPTELIRKYQDRIIQLQKEIDTRQFVYTVGQRYDPNSSFSYRKTREDEIDDIKGKIKDERNREQLLSHNILNKQLTDQGIQTLSEKPTDMENWITFLNKGTPIGILADAVKPMTQGIGNFISSPMMPFILLAVGIVVIIVIMKF